MSDVLAKLTEADAAWAARRRVRPSAPGYLVHLAAAFGGDPLDVTAELERITVERDAAREHVRTLVCAVTGRWGRLRTMDRQVAEALHQLDVVRAHLDALYGHSPQARAG